MRTSLSSKSLSAALFVALLLQFGCRDHAIAPQSRVLRLATTTSTRDSGLLDLLLPPFEQEQNVRVDVIAAGTGKALKLGESGDVDVVLVHAREAEDAFMAASHGSRREDVMVNNFELLGPPDDPAGIRDCEVSEALERIVMGGFPFVSRGDDSGTHKRELKFWDQVGGKPDWPEYVETGQGMGATLIIADQMLAYVLTDRGTYLRIRPKMDLIPLTRKSPEMGNPYGIIVVNGKRHLSAQTELSEALVDYFISPRVQTMIQNFQISGEPLFFPLQLTPGL